MAKILLDPGEEFEHFHRDKSTTKLIAGNVKLEYDNQIIILRENEIVYIDGNVSHISTNIGDTVCILDCGHGSGGKYA